MQICKFDIFGTSGGPNMVALPKFCSSTPIRREGLGMSSSSASKKMAEIFTLFAIEEEIAVQMPKNIARIAKIQLDE